MIVRLWLVVAFLWPEPARAIPAFARKYGMTCATCHANVYPELNPFGRRFQERGYALPPGAEEPYRDAATMAPGTTGERLLLWREVPLALRARGTVVVPVEAEETGRNAADLRLLEDLQLLAGGAVFDRVSFFAAASVAPDPVIHHATVGVHDLFGEDVLHLRAGQLLLFDFLRPEHRQLTRLGNPAATVAVGLNPTVLDTTHLGLDAWGRLLDERLFWHAALVQGAQGADGLSDLDSHKDGFAEVQATPWDDLTLGVLGYLGRTQITDATNGVMVRFTDPFVTVGADAELRVGPLGIFALGLHGVHEDPFGLGERSSYTSWRLEGDLTITPRLLAIVRWDQVEADEPALEAALLTAHATYLVLANLKLLGELQADLADFHRSTVFVRLDVAL